MALERERLEVLSPETPAPLSNPTTPVPPAAEPTTGWTRNLPQSVRRIPVRVWLPAALLLLLLALGAGGYATYSIWLVERATITVVPVSLALSQNISVDAIRGSPSPTQAEVTAYTASSQRASATHKASGVGHQQAVQASGTIWFYNLASYEITVLSGTVFVGRDGVSVATDAPAYVPAGNPPQSLGSTFVSAHAVNPGAWGNIGALDVNVALTGNYNGLEAKNSAAFSGGQDETTYPVVAKADVTSAAAPLVTTLTRSAQAALQTQLGTHEQFLAQATCTPQVAADPAVGQPASQVSVSVQVTCRRDAYNQLQVQELATASFSGQTSAQLGAGYAPVGSPTTASVQVIPANLGQGHYTLVVPVSGRFAYQFSRPMLEYLTEQLAGKSSAAASSLLLNTPGIAQATIGLTGWNNGDLPTDTTQIHLVVVHPHSA